MLSPTTKDVIKIIRTYVYENGKTVSEFAREAGVSKSWISRLYHEDSEISLLLANRLLEQAGYKMVVKHNTQLNRSDTEKIEVLTDDQIRRLRRRNQ